MPKRLKKPLIVLLCLLALLLVFQQMRDELFIQNIFDEMYYGAVEIWGGQLTRTSWQGFKEASPSRYLKEFRPSDMACDRFLTNQELRESSMIWLMWIKSTRSLQITYAWYPPEEGDYWIDLVYNPRANRLTVERFIMGYGAHQSIEITAPEDAPHAEEAVRHAKEDLWTYLIEPWRAANLDTGYPDSLGKLTIVDDIGLELAR